MFQSLTNLVLTGAKPKGKRSHLWPMVRAAHLERQPVCQACGAKKRLEVHHILPFHMAPDRELEPSNLLTLCEGLAVNCHFLYGHLRNWKAWNPMVKLDAAIWREKMDRRQTS